MSDTTDLAQRLTTVQRILSYLTIEVGAIQAALQGAPTIDQSVPHSPASAQGVDLQALISQVDQAASTIAPVVDDSPESKAIKEFFFGSNSLLTRYLSADAIAGGQGVIAAGWVLKQYTDDILTAIPQRLLMWPSGFYRNATTKDQQLFLKSPDRHHLVCIDGLPSNTPQVLLYHYSQDAREFLRIELAADKPMASHEVQVALRVVNECLHSSLATFTHEELTQKTA